MRTCIALIVCLVMASCSFHQTELYGIGKTTDYHFAGDGSSANTVLGDSAVTKNSTATKTLAQAAGTALVGHYGVLTNSSNNLNKTAQEANGRLPTVTPAQSVAPGTTVFPLVTQPAAAILPKH